MTIPLTFSLLEIRVPLSIEHVKYPTHIAQIEVKLSLLNGKRSHDEQICHLITCYDVFVAGASHLSILFSA